MRGSERTVSSAPLGLARIVWPRGRSIVDGRAALEDPEFRVVFEARPAFRSLLWRINGLPLGSGASVAWPPRAGRYRLELLTPAGVLIDSREFAARGPL